MTDLAAVDSIAQQYGVPSGIWKDVAYTESGFNPTRIGDNGTSFGLFQLHYPGGQGDAAIAAGYSTQDLLDPSINAKFAMPALSRAWQNLQGSFNATNASWWSAFASQSGHPGGSPGNKVTDNEAALLEQNYGSGSVCNPMNIGLMPGLGCSPIAQAGQTAKTDVIDPATQLLQNVQGVIGAAPDALINIGLFLVAIILLSVGFFILASGGEDGS